MPNSESAPNGGKDVLIGLIISHSETRKKQSQIISKAKKHLTLRTSLDSYSIVAQDENAF